MNRWMQEFSHFIAKNGLRQSSQREQVARIFFGTKDHIAIEELYKKVQSLNSKIGIATVYRTLNLLVESGLAQKRNFETGAITNEPTREKHHDHLICTQCHEVIEFHHERIEELQEEIAKRYKYQLESHKLDLYCLCQKCSKLKKNKRI